VAIHFTHRLGALLVAALLLLAAFSSLRGLGAGPPWPALGVQAALPAPISIGVLIVLRAFPLELAAAHNAGAALLVATTVWLNRGLRPVRDFR
jgi:cytochrome c oxidase assembly protein subunit 15